MQNQPNHEKRVALVTGGNRGIGFEVARKLAALDIAVLIGARNRESGLQAQERLKGEGLEVDFIPLDVTNAQSIQTAFGRIKDNIRRLDILVNNAGIRNSLHSFRDRIPKGRNLWIARCATKQ